MKNIAMAAFGVVVFALPAHAAIRCLQIGRIWSTKALDARTLIVEDELHEKFRVGLMGYCPALPFKLSFGFKSNSGVNELDCLTRGDEVISRDVGVPYTCPIMSIAPYTPAAQPPR